MKITVIGYGNMGKMVESAALGRGHDVNTVDRKGNAKSKELDSNSDVYIDFTHPESVMGNIEKISSFGKPMVVGTTGWYDQLDKVKYLVSESETGLIYASNFSIGMNAFIEMVGNAAKLMDRLDYDVAGFEIHHNKKADSPSGTAKTLAELLKKNIEIKDKIVYDTLNRKIEPNELHFTSLRCGSIPGTHKIIFDSKADTIELTHTARGREGFALGAVLAAEWIVGRKGFFTISDMLRGVES